ncbi:MAG: MBL fold metallo-hydrolase [Anaerolineales bacterium]
MSTTTAITYLGHATVLIEMDGLRLLTDPALTSRIAHLRRVTAAAEPATYQDIDAVLISHLHADHLDLRSLRLLDVSIRVLAPVGSAHLLSKLGLKQVDEFRIGEVIRLGALSIRSTHAEHRGFRYPFGPDGDAMGFLIKGSQSIYFAGDTDLFNGMAEVEPELDVALLPVWGWGPTIGGGHLSPRTAAEALKLLRPRMTVPIHWGTYCPIGLEWLNPSFLSRPPKEFEKAANATAPDVRVHILAPGAGIELTGGIWNAHT